MFLYWHKIRKPKEYKVRQECREHWKTPVTWSYSLLLSRAVVRWNVSSRGVGPRGRHLKRYQPVGQTELECVALHPDRIGFFFFRDQARTPKPDLWNLLTTLPEFLATNVINRLYCNNQCKLDHRNSCGILFFSAHKRVTFCATNRIVASDIRY